MGTYRFISQEDPENSILEIDPHQEIIKIISSDGSHVGMLSWGTLIHVIVEGSSAPDNQTVRKITRAPLAIKVYYRQPVEQETQSMTGCIGAGGLFIETGSPYPVNTDLTVRFTLPTQPEAPIAAQGKVSWVRATTERFMRMPGMGIKFTDIEDTTRLALTQFIHKTMRW